MQIVDINNAQNQLAALIHSAVAGEDIIISEAGKELVRLAPVVFNTAPRVGGQLRGKFKVPEQ